MDLELKEERRRRILEYINSKSYIPMKVTELVVMLDVPNSDIEEFTALIDELEEDGLLYRAKWHIVLPIKRGRDLAVGTLSCSATSYSAFLYPDDGGESIYIPGENTKPALHGDKVLVAVDSIPTRGRRTGHVKKVLKKTHNAIIIGTVEKFKGETFRIKPDDPRIFHHVRVHPPESLNAEVGDRVVCEILGVNDKNAHPYGKINAILAKEENFQSLVEGVIFTSGIKREFDEATLAATAAVPSEVSPSEIEGRLDLREKKIFTIDGDSARDFDDAVSIEILSNGIYRLGVHIADVTHYVREGSTLDSEAYERATSVYFPDRVIPMLPERLSNGICSLNPNVDRLTLSVIMDIDQNGAVISHTLDKSVIRSCERMTYTNVNKILEDGDEELSHRYAYILPELEKMAELAGILNEKRDKRGAICFDFPETEVEVNTDGFPSALSQRVRGTSERMIEEFMIAANETVAEYAYWSELPFVYRVHDAPNIEKLNAFNQFIQNFGLKIKGRTDDDIQPKALQTVLDAAKGTPNERAVAANMLRSLMKAEYSYENRGHFGLASKYYCHFTSPIRRYPDLAIHRILKEFIGGGLTGVRRENLVGFAARTAVHSSEAEITAENAERDMRDLMITAYMSQFVGEAFDGMVVSIQSFGMFVELENGAEGFIPPVTMTDDYYRYIDGTGTFVGEHTGREYHIGDPVRIVVTKCDLHLRRMDFVLESDYRPVMEGKTRPKSERKAEHMREARKRRRHRKAAEKKAARAAAAKAAPSKPKKKKKKKNQNNKNSQNSQINKGEIQNETVV